MRLDDHAARANFAVTGGTLILYRDYRDLVTIARAAEIVLREIETDLPGHCLICAGRDDDHTPDCPVPGLRRSFARLEATRTTADVVEGMAGDSGFDAGAP